MQARINLFILVCLVGLVTVSFAQEAVVPSFPYIAEITGDNINVRSGPGTQYYSCGKLNKLDKVRVVSSKFSWSQIVPPAGSFSWISKQYVSIDPDNPDIGTLTGDAVRVYAGSEHVKPIHSTTMQLKLNTGDKVRLMGQGQGDYYKISPPVGAYLWISTKYTEVLGPVGEVEVVVEPELETDVIDTGESVVPVALSVESEKLKNYYALEKKIRTERDKPIIQQNYTDIKKAITEIAADKGAGKAARYAGFAIRKIERYELALEVEKAVRLQDAQLQQTKERIDHAYAARLAEIQDLGGFVAVGKFRISSIYGFEEERRHYFIVDDFGKIACYALPSGPASELDLSEFVGHKVGLVGTIELHPQTSGALVKFTEIVELN